MSKKLTLSEVLTPAEIYAHWNVKRSTLQSNVRAHKFEDSEIRKSGRIFLFTLDGLIRMYGPPEIPFENCYNKKFNFSDIISISEAVQRWSLNPSTIRDYMTGRMDHGKFREGKFLPDEFRQSGRNFIVTVPAVIRVFGPEK